MKLKFNPQELNAIQNRIEKLEVASDNKVTRVNYLMEELSMTRLEAEDIVEGLNKGIKTFNESYNGTVSSSDMMTAINKTLENLGEYDKHAYLVNLLALMQLRESSAETTELDEFLKEFHSQKSPAKVTTEELMKEIQVKVNEDSFIPGLDSKDLVKELDTLKNDSTLSSKVKEYTADEKRTRNFATAVYVCLRKGEIKLPDSLKEEENIDPVVIGISSASSEKEAEITSDYAFGKISKGAFLKAMRIITGVAYCCLLAYGAYLCLFGATLIAFATIYLGLAVGPVATVLAIIGSGCLLYDTFRLVVEIAEKAWNWGKEKYSKFENALALKIAQRNAQQTDNEQSININSEKSEAELAYE